MKLSNGLGDSFGSFFAAQSNVTRARFVPEAELNPGILNVGFGDVVYQGVAESKASYIDRGADAQLICTKQLLHVYNFFSDFQRGKELATRLS